MRVLSIFWILVLGSVLACYGQKASKGDRYFYEYNYSLAIEEYLAEQQDNFLTPQQRLNLAEAYFKTKKFEKASDLYVELFKADSLISNHHFNSMLQALSKSSGQDRMKAFLGTRENALTDDILENAQFNYELFENKEQLQPYSVFLLNINSPQSDFSPAYYGEDRLLFTSSRPQEDKSIYGPTGEAYMDIFMAVRDPEGQARSPKALTWLPPLQFHEATPFYSEALNGIIYVRSNAQNEELTFDENGKNSLVVGLAKRDGTFQFLLRDPSTSFYYPFYEDRTQRLYFAAEFEQGYGGTDLYYVETSKGRIMSAPINLGSRINSPGNEIAPFIHEGSLYFASDVFYGLGGMDLYKANIREGELFSIPVNLGPEINTPEDEFGLILKTEPNGTFAGYFSSNRPGGPGKDDIYGFTTQYQPGLKTRVLQGIVTSVDGQPLEKAELRIEDADGKEVKTIYTREDGSFYLELPWMDDLQIRITKERHNEVSIDAQASLLASESGDPILAMLTLVDDAVRERDGRFLLRAERMHFARGSSRLTPEIEAALQPAIRALLDFPQLRLRIEAHTDSRGSNATNIQLSQQRAKAIQQYMISQGVARECITEIEGMGESQILNNCTDGVYCLEVLHQQNERYPLVILNYEDL